MPTATQAEQAINTLVAQPVDKLATIIGILGMVLVVLLVVFGWRLFRYISNENSPLVRAFNGIRDAFNGIKATNTTVAENLSKVLDATKEQTGVLREFKDFQKLNNDQVSNVGDKVEGLSKSVDKNTESIAALEAAIMKEIAEIKIQLEDIRNKHLDCPDLKPDLEAFQAALLAKLQQQPIVNAVSNVTVDAPPSAQAAA